MKLKSHISLLFTLLLVSQAWGQDANLKILCVNDLHAAIDNMPKLAFVVDSIRQEHPDALLMAAGDTRTGNPFNDKCAVPNKPMVDLMNLMGFEMSTMGNHECDGGIESFVRTINDSFFPYVVANAYPADSLKMHISPFRLFQRNGVKVGVLGLVQVNDQGIPDCHPNLVKGIRFTNPFAEADNYKWLRDRCDVYIGLTHLGIEEDTIMADRHPEFDLLVCGHSHDLVPGTVRNGVMMVQGERWAKYLNEIDITVRDGKVVDRKCKTIDVLAATGVNPKAQAMVDEYNRAAEFYRVLAVATRPFEAAEELGCMMADGTRVQLDTDFAIVNAGCVRYCEKEAGDITVNDILKLDPFDNELMIARINGHQIAEALTEIAVTDHYGPAFVSGLRYEIVQDRNDLQKYTVTLFDEEWKPLDLDKTYTLAVNSYLATITPAIVNANPENTFEISADVIMKYLENQKTVDYNGERRIKMTLEETCTLEKKKAPEKGL